MATGTMRSVAVSNVARQSWARHRINRLAFLSHQCQTFPSTVKEIRGCQTLIRCPLNFADHQRTAALSQSRERYHPSNISTQILQNRNFGIISGLKASVSHTTTESLTNGVDPQTTRAIANYMEQLRDCPEDSSRRPKIYHDLGIWLYTKYEQSRVKAQEDIDSAIAALKRALIEDEKLLEAAPEELFLYNWSLMKVLYQRYHHTGSLEDFEEATKHASQASTSAFSKLQFESLNDILVQLANEAARLPMPVEQIARVDGYILTGCEGVLRAAIKADVPGSDVSRFRGNLTNQYMRQYLHSSDIHYLSKAIETLKLALSDVADSYRVLMICNLAIFLKTRHNASPSNYPDDFNEGMASLAEAIESNKDSMSAIDRAKSFDLLGTFYSARYLKWNDPADLDMAINCAEDATAAIPEDDSSRAAILSNLGSKYQLRFRKTGALEDIDRSIELVEDALKGKGISLAERNTFMSNLQIMLGLRSDKTNSKEDSSRCFMYAKQIFEETPFDSPHYAKNATQYFEELYIRYKQTGNFAELKEAIGTAKAAVEATIESKNYFGLPHRLRRLAAMELDLYDLDPKAYFDSLELALQYGAKAIELLPGDHADIADYYIDLAKGFLKSSLLEIEHLRDAETDKNRTTDPLMAKFMAAEMCFDSAAQSINSPPQVRLRASYLGTNLTASKHGELKFNEKRQSQINLFRNLPEMVQKLIPLLPRDYFKPKEGQEYLSEITELLSRTAGMILDRGIVGEDDETTDVSRTTQTALQVLDYGRSFIFSNIMDLHKSLGADDAYLRFQYPDQSIEFDRLRESLDKGESTTAKVADYLEGLRQQPGLHTLYYPLTPDELLPAASNGPVVVINVTKFRSDALIIDGQAFRSVPLPNLTYQDAQLYNFDNLHRNESTKIHVSGEGADRSVDYHARVKETLAWLWDVAVQPILRDLGFLERAPGDFENLPRMWWIGIGVLAGAPFHAAGRYQHSPLEETKDEFTARFCMSSYTTTVQTLLISQILDILPKSPEDDPTKPLTPTDNDVLFIGDEEEVKKFDVPGLPGSSITTEDDSSRARPVIFGPPTEGGIATKISEYGMVHFACEAIVGGPHGAVIHVKTGTNENNIETIPLQDISEPRHHSIINLEKKIRRNFAYIDLPHPAPSRRELSKTETFDEPLLLTSVFGLCGFTRVVGPLWQVPEGGWEEWRRFNEGVRRGFYLRVGKGMEPYEAWFWSVEGERRKKGWRGKEGVWAAISYWGI